MKTLYIVKYGCGQWEDYHEDIECMYETFDGIAQAMASQWGTFVKHEMEKNND